MLSQVRFGDKVFSPVIAEGETDLLIGFEPLETARSTKKAFAAGRARGSKRFYEHI